MTQPIDIRALAQLARLEVSDVEMEKLQKEIPTILSFVEEIQKAPTFEGERVGGLRNVTRDDSVTHESGQYTERLLAAAPASKDGRVAVTQVISRKKN